MNQTTRLLLIEDNNLDIRLLRLAIESVEWPLEIICAQDGEEAMTLLAQVVEGSFQIPDLVVLDFNLPCHDGAEILRFIRENQSLARIPVAVLTSSPIDVIEEKFALSGVVADCYLIKPCGLDEFLALGRLLHAFYNESRVSDEPPALK